MPAAVPVGTAGPLDEPQPVLLVHHLDDDHIYLAEGGKVLAAWT